MKNKRIYLYPMNNLKVLEMKRPYMNNLSKTLIKHFSVVNYGITTRHGMLDVFKFFSKADVFYFNWIENIAWYQLPLFVAMVVFSKLAGKRVIWTHHNMHPHKGDTMLGRFIIGVMKIWSDNIVFHTGESYKVLSLDKGDERVLYYFHPFFSMPEESNERRLLKSKSFDLLIWGNIRKSKGIDAFMQFLKERSLLDKYRIKIIGKFESDAYFVDFKNNYSGLNISIENRYTNTEELKKLHSATRFVFFSYTGTSVLNSGALITSLPYGAPIIGPKIGAFAELGNMQLIHLYSDFTDVLKYLELKDEANSYNPGLVKQFCLNHTWPGFGEFLAANIFKPSKILS